MSETVSDWLLDELRRFRKELGIDEPAHGPVQERNAQAGSTTVPFATTPVRASQNHDGALGRVIAQLADANIRIRELLTALDEKEGIRRGLEADVDRLEGEVSALKEENWRAAEKRAKLYYTAALEEADDKVEAAEQRYSRLWDRVLDALEEPVGAEEEE